MNDLELGQEVLTQFNILMKKFWYKTYSAEEIAAASNMKFVNIMVDGIGLTYRTSGESKSDMIDAMEALVVASAGRVPTFGAFNAAIRDEATGTFSFMEFAGETKNPVLSVLAGSASSILDGAEYLGNGLINTGADTVKAVENTAKALSYLLPVLVIGALGFYLYLNVQNAPKIPKTKAA